MTIDQRLEAQHLTVSYDDTVILDGLDLIIAPGKITAIVGGNGCGKSTLLRALARLLRPKSGVVLLDGKAMHSLPSRQVARTLALLPQSPICPEGITVSDLVGRGRHPHQRAFSSWNHRDREAVAAAMTATGIADLAGRSIDELSGGQRQRVWIALALAQDTDILLLDEPTTFLDVAHQIDVLDVLADLNCDRRTTIVMVLHDLNLAARYADELITVLDGGIHSVGAPLDVINAEMVRAVFGLDCQVITDPTSGAPLVLPLGRRGTAIRVRG